MNPKASLIQEIKNFLQNNAMVDPKKKKRPMIFKMDPLFETLWDPGTHFHEFSTTALLYQIVLIFCFSALNYIGENHLKGYFSGLYAELSELCVQKLSDLATNNRYELPISDFEKNTEEWPEVAHGDTVNYFVFGTNSVAHQ